MTTRERILTIKLIEKAKKYPKYAKKIGIEINKNITKNSGENKI